jgi:hypothetical protein
MTVAFPDHATRPPVLRPAPPPVPTDGSVLVRLAAPDQSWARRLPAVPGGRTLTVTVGHPALLPVPVDDLVGGGYRIVGVAAVHRPVGRTIDVLVPGDLLGTHPQWWEQLVTLAERVFDLRHGPVQRVFAAELDLHLREPAAG